MSELGDKIRAMKTGSLSSYGQGIDEGLDRAAVLADEHAATQLSNDERLEYQQALIWCSAAADFAPEGQAREGWLKLCKPLIDRQPIEGASRDNWNAWLDDLPLPEGFEEGIAALQHFIAGLPADEHAATVAAARVLLDVMDPAVWRSAIAAMEPILRADIQPTAWNSEDEIMSALTAALEQIAKEGEQ